MLRRGGWLFRGSDEKDQRGQNDKLQALIADEGGTIEVSHRLTISQLSPPVTPFCHTCHPLSHMLHNHMFHLSYLLSAAMSFSQYCHICHQWSFSSHVTHLCQRLSLLSSYATTGKTKHFLYSNIFVTNISRFGRQFEVVIIMMIMIMIIIMIIACIAVDSITFNLPLIHPLFRATELTTRKPPHKIIFHCLHCFLLHKPEIAKLYLLIYSTIITISPVLAALHNYTQYQNCARYIVSTRYLTSLIWTQ